MQLIEQILHKCQWNQWYGTDWMLHMHGPKDDEPLLSRFHYPPATEEEIQATEAVLGFRLPEELRHLYLHLANGGFGPDDGIIGVHGGCTVTFLEVYPTGIYDMEGNFLQDEFYQKGLLLADIYRIQTKNITFIDLAKYVPQMKKQGYVDLPYTVFPVKLCLFGQAGGGMGYLIDCSTGAIYRSQGVTARTYRLTWLADSLGTWLQPWLENRWSSPLSERMNQPIPEGATRHETPEEYQHRKRVTEQLRLSLRREPREFYGPHAELLRRIYARCVELGGLIFPPATEEQVRAAEERLGQPLPSLLRDVYLQIANGGFGPTYGLFGLEGGYLSERPSSEGLVSIVETLLREDDTEQGLLLDEEEIQSTGYFSFYEGGPMPYARPFDCIRLTSDGCGLYSWLHLDSGRVFQSAYCAHNQMRYELTASSLEEWFEKWLAEEKKYPESMLQSLLNHAVWSLSLLDD